LAITSIYSKREERHSARLLNDVENNMELCFCGAIKTHNFPQEIEEQRRSVIHHIVCGRP
jgi:hypothetical protein